MQSAVAMTVPLIWFGSHCNRICDRNIFLMKLHHFRQLQGRFYFSTASARVASVKVLDYCQCECILNETMQLVLEKIKKIMLVLPL